jgi:site-specific DNA-methyltransferase (adenine-specific)/site-specific DNA-methyltransferase (cytosine-N4-specific)
MDKATLTGTSRTEKLIKTPSGPSRIIVGDARRVLKELEPASFRCCVTSPPYWGVRDYGVVGQIGEEEVLEEYVAGLVEVFSDVWRLLSDDGTLWLNVGDTYTSGDRATRAPDKKNPARAMEYRPPTPDGLKPKDLIGIPWKVAFALQQNGWYLRSDVIWYKPNCQPESVKDRPTKAHEYLFLLSKSERYYYDNEAVKEHIDANGKKRNKRSVWTVNTVPFNGAHFATFPPSLIEPCIQASSEQGDFVLDPFFGAGTVGETCLRLGREFVGVEINEEYAALARRRLGWE